MTLVPDKMSHPHGMQIMFDKDGHTRNLYVYAEKRRDMVDWYTAIRAAKLIRYRIAYPGANDEDVSHVIDSFTCCPSPDDVYFVAFEKGVKWLELQWFYEQRDLCFTPASIVATPPLICHPPPRVVQGDGDREVPWPLGAKSPVDSFAAPSRRARMYLERKGLFTRRTTGSESLQPPPVDKMLFDQSE